MSHATSVTTTNTTYNVFTMPERKRWHSERDTNESAYQKRTNVWSDADRIKAEWRMVLSEC